jgi:predicted nucleotidyltransferase
MPVSGIIRSPSPVRDAVVPYARSMRNEESGAEQGEAVLAEAAEAYREALGPRLVAAYALGSLAHGGFSVLVSDVDLGLVLADPVSPSDEETLQAVAHAVKERDSSLHQRLSVFWGTSSTLQGRVEGGRFPPVDRLDLIEHGRLLFGQDMRHGMVRPDPAELLIAGAEFALDFLCGGRGSPGSPSPGLGSMPPAGDDAVEEIRQPELLVSRGPRRLTKVVLFPVRFLFTAMTGRVGTNSLAAEHYLALAQAPGSNLVLAALGWRLAAPEDKAVAADLLGRELLPLYLRYIDDHAARLAAARRPDLSDGFKHWRARLVA